MSRLDTKKVLVEDLNKIAQEAFSVIAVDYRGTNVPVSYTHLTLPTR